MHTRGAWYATGPRGAVDWRVMHMNLGIGDPVGAEANDSIRLSEARIWERCSEVDSRLTKTGFSTGFVSDLEAPLTVGARTRDRR